MIMLLLFYLLLTSLIPRPEPAGTMTDADGNIYKTVRIGDQVWMAENLRVTHYNNGDPIAFIPDYEAWEKTTEGAYSIYMEDTAAVAAYGLLYNGRVVLDERGIAPEGWRVPTNDDWKELLIYFGIDTTTRLPETTTEKRPPGERVPDMPSVSFLVGPPFDALSAGGRFYDGRYAGRGNLEYWWSGTPYNSANAWFCGLAYAHKGQRYYEASGDIRQGFGIRLIKE